MTKRNLLWIFIFLTGLLQTGCQGSGDSSVSSTPPSSSPPSSTPPSNTPPANVIPPTFVNAALQAYAKASNAEGGDGFGIRVALSGDTLAVAADTEDSCAIGINGDQTTNGCPVAGAVYVFTRTNGVWSQQAYLKASNTESKDELIEVALSGDTLAVGAPGESSCAMGINGDQANNDCNASGAVYVFTRTNGVWSQQAYLKASNTGVDDLFGSSVALSGDTLAVGAVREDSCATGTLDGDQTNNDCSNSGAVYVFTRTNGIWSQQAYVKAFSNPDADDFFGDALSLDGDTLAVGAPGEASCASGINTSQNNNDCRKTLGSGAGAVFVYTRTNGIWSQQAYVKASNTDADDFFGDALSLNGDTLAVGARLEDSCATGINGVGFQSNNGCSQAGAVYVFTRINGIWSQQAYVKASNTQASDNFGSSIAVSGDFLAVGAFGEASCTTGINGNQTNNGCIMAGAAYVFSRTNGIWSQQAYMKASNTGAADEFNIVALSGDTLAVGSIGEASCGRGTNGDPTNNGCPLAGAVYVYVAQ